MLSASQYPNRRLWWSSESNDWCSCAACDDEEGAKEQPCRCMLRQQFSLNEFVLAFKFSRFRHNLSQHQSNWCTSEDLVCANHISEISLCYCWDYWWLAKWSRCELPQKGRLFSYSNLGDQWCIFFIADISGALFSVCERSACRLRWWRAVICTAQILIRGHKFVFREIVPGQID